MTTLFKHSLVLGVSSAMQDAGVVSFPSEKVAFEVAGDIASHLAGPEVPTEPLDKQSALLIANMLKSASDELAARGHRPTAADAQLSKQASAMDFGLRVATLAEACMSKAASEASLNGVGQLTPEVAAQVDQVNKLDQMNRPTNKYNLGFGRTEMPSGGVVGKQQFVNGSSHNNSLSALDKQASVEELLARLKGAPASVAHSARMLGQDVADAASQYGRDLKAIPDAIGMRWHNRDPNHGLSRDDLMAILSAAGPAAKKTAIGLGAAGGAAGLGYGASQMMGGEKEASAGMTAEDLNIQEPLHRSALFLEAASRIPGYTPDDAAKVAAAGLGIAGDKGLEVMAAFVDNIKTASDADAAIAQILNHQGEVGELASPELVAALQQMLAQQEDDGSPEGMLTNAVVPSEKAAASTPYDLAVRPASELGMPRGGFLSRHKGKIAGGLAAAGAIAAAAAALSKDKDKDKKGEKTSSLLNRLKAAADGSLTDVPPLTPEGAAKVDQVNKLDLQNRDVNEHNLGPGKTKMPSSGQGAMQTKAPKAESSGASNSLDADKQAADAEYAEAFRKIAMEFGPELPATYTREQKVATLQQLMAIPPGERRAYLEGRR